MLGFAFTFLSRLKIIMTKSMPIVPQSSFCNTIRKKIELCLKVWEIFINISQPFPGIYKMIIIS